MEEGRRKPINRTILIDPYNGATLIGLDSYRAYSIDLESRRCRTTIGFIALHMYRAIQREIIRMIWAWQVVDIWIAALPCLLLRFPLLHHGTFTHSDHRQPPQLIHPSKPRCASSCFLSDPLLASFALVACVNRHLKWLSVVNSASVEDYCDL